MSVYVNGNIVTKIMKKDDDIALVKLNGDVLFPNYNQINISCLNKVLYLHGYYGEYDLVYGDDNGILTDYDRIGIGRIQNEYGELPYLMNLNIAPEGATKIYACKKNTTEILAELKIPHDLLFDSDLLGEKLYSFGALSDVHIDGDGTDEASAANDFAKALQFFNSNATLVAISGDLTITNSSAENELSLYKGLVDNNATIPVYASRGNHDCRFTIEEFETYTGGTLYFEKIHNDDVFMFIGMNAENYADSMLTTKELYWLDTKLENYKNKRVFLFFHVFMTDTCGNINGYYPYNSMDLTAHIPQVFNRFMIKYKNVIYFSGHSHLEFYCQRLGPNANIYSNGTTCFRVHIPSCAKPRVNYEGDSDDTYSFYDGSEGYLVDVYKDYIVLKGINFIKGKFVPMAHYVLNTKDYEVIEDNLYDYLNTPVDYGWINSSNGFFTKTSYGDCFTYIEIEPNTTYKVKKLIGSRFGIATVGEIPTENIQLTNTVSSPSSAELSITSGENDKYLMIYYWYVNVDGDTEEEYRRSITVERTKNNGNLLNYHTIDLVNWYYDNSGNQSGFGSFNFVSQNINVNSNKKYLTSFDTITGSAYIRISEFKSDGTFIKRTLVNTSPYEITFDTNTSYVNLCIDKHESKYFTNLRFSEISDDTIEDDNLLKLYKENAEWVAYAGTEASATYNDDNTITINADGSDSWGLNIAQPGLTLKAGTTYRLSCDNLESSTWISVNNKDDMMIRKSVPSIDFTPSEDIVEPIIIIWVDTGTVYTDTTWNIKIIEVIDESNLWSKAVKLNNVYLDTDLSILGTNTSSTYSSAYIPCEPNTVYKITRTMDGYRFRLGNTALLPESGVAYNNYLKADDSKDIDYTTSSDANYLVIYYGGSSETLDRDELFNDIVVTKVETEVGSTNLFTGSDIALDVSGATFTSPVTRSGITYEFSANNPVITISGTATTNPIQYFEQSNTLYAGKKYRLTYKYISGEFDLGSKDYLVNIFAVSDYVNATKLGESEKIYAEGTTEERRSETFFTLTEDISQWWVGVQQKSSEVSCTNYAFEIIVEEVTDSVNLYDYSTAPTLDGYISRSAYTIKGSTIDKTTYLQIEPNSKYKVTKTASTRFVIGTFSDIPAIGGASGTKVIDDYTGTTLYITSGENDNYLAIQYYVTSDTLTEEAIRQSIEVIKMENTTENNLMPNFTAVSGTVADVSYSFIEGTNKISFSGTASSSSHIYSEQFVMNLIIGKTYAFRFNVIAGTIDASAHEDSYYDKTLIAIDSAGNSIDLVYKSDVETPFHEQQFVVTQEYAYYQIDLKFKSSDIYTDVEIEVEIVQLD